MGHPMLFPFDTGATARDAMARPRLELFRGGRTRTWWGGGTVLPQTGDLVEIWR